MSKVTCTGPGCKFCAPTFWAWFALYMAALSLILVVGLLLR